MILILNGSPNSTGNTVSVINAILKGVQEEVKIINAYEISVASCDDCKYCNYKSGCSKKDNMNDIYLLLEKANTLVIASPLYFATLSPELLKLISRFQTYFSQKYIRKQSVPRINKGILLITAGGYWEGMFSGAKETFKVLSKLFGFEKTIELLVPRCDNENPLLSVDIEPIRSFLAIGI